jgi:3-hydroxyisobutyrate dehydrogenase
VFMTKVSVGVVGLGNMGRGVAKNFAEAGYSTAVWDIDNSALEYFRDRNNVFIMSPDKMALEGATLFYVVPATLEIEKTLLGDEGVLANAFPETTIFDLTTSFPEDTKRVAALASEKGIYYMDAAMSGGATGADSGELTLMIGGNEDVFNKHRDLLVSIAKNIYYLGESGAGHAMKLIHNMVVHTIFLTNCEAGRLAEAAGISLKDMIEVFNNSNARSYSSEFRFPRHILSETWDARSRVYNLNKDLGMAVRMAHSMGVEANYTNQTYNFLEKAINMGMSEKDYSLLYPQFDNIRDSDPV